MSKPGPVNYVAAVFRMASTANALAGAINTVGTYEAVVVNPRKSHYEVVLPGACVPGTETYMRGFVEAFCVLGYGAPVADARDAAELQYAARKNVDALEGLKAFNAALKEFK